MINTDMCVAGVCIPAFVERSHRSSSLSSAERVLPGYVLRPLLSEVDDLRITQQRRGVAGVCTPAFVECRYVFANRQEPVHVAGFCIPAFDK